MVEKDIDLTGKNVVLRGVEERHVSTLLHSFSALEGQKVTVGEKSSIRAGGGENMWHVSGDGVRSGSTVVSEILLLEMLGYSGLRNIRIPLFGGEVG